MKKILYLICSIYFINSSAQKANVYVRDLVTNDMDTLYFGYDDKSTIGIDTFLGEKNIRSEPLKPLDFRILQRDSNDFYCLHPFGGKNLNGDIVYDSVLYSPSFDSKINYRPKDSVNRYFEIFMNYQHNVRFYIEFNISLKYFLDRILLYVKACPESKPIIALGNDPNLGEAEVALFNAFDTGYHLIWVFKDSISIPTKNEDISKGSYIKVYPNPFKDLLSIESDGNFDQLEITDVDGKMLFKDFQINGLTFYQAKCKEWPPGYYFLRVLDKDQKEVIVKKLIKI